MRKTMAALTALIPAGAWLAVPAAAQDFNCPPEPAFPIVPGNLVVAARCEIDGKRILGNVRIFSGGSLVARQIDVSGNLEAETAIEIELVGSRIRGNLELVDLVGDSSAIVATRVEGNVLLERNRPFLSLEDNELDSDVEARNNRGGVNFVDNEIDGDLDCRGNNPEPTGRGNDIEGEVEGQCRNLSEQEGEEPPPAPPPPPVPPAPPAPPAPVPPVPPAPPAPVPPASPEPPPPAPPASGGPTTPPTYNSTGGGGGSVDPVTLAVLALLLLGWIPPFRPRH